MVAGGQIHALAGLIETNGPHKSDARTLVAHVMPRIDINEYADYMHFKIITRVYMYSCMTR